MSSRLTMSSEPFSVQKEDLTMDWAQVEQQIVEDDRNKWDRKASAEEMFITQTAHST